MNWSNCLDKIKNEELLVRFREEVSTMPGKNNRTSERGFASMPQQKRREIASKGGKAAHEKGTAHEFTSEEARIAGRKGGQRSGGRRSQS